jgi:hypothetical protein
MSQTRYFNTGDPASSARMRDFMQALHPEGVYSGFDVTADGPELLGLSAGDLLFPTGIGLRESADQTVAFVNPSVPTTYTLAYQHEDGGFIGGQDAALVLLVGKQTIVTNGIPLAFIKHPGSGTLSQAMITAVPKLKVPFVVLDQVHRESRVERPPFPDALNVAISAEVTIPGATSDGDVTYTAQSAGTGGNSVRVRHVVAGLNTPLSVSVAANDITVNLATNGAGVATTTGAQAASAVNAAAPAFALVAARTNGTGLGLAAAAGFTFLTGGLAAAGVDISTALVYVRSAQRTAFKVTVGAPAAGTETYVLLFAFTASELPPKKLTLGLNLAAGSNFALILRDTLGKAVATSPSAFGATAGWVDVDAAITGQGTFTPGETWYLQVNLSGPANTVLQLGAIETVYDAVAVV